MTNTTNTPHFAPITSRKRMMVGAIGVLFLLGLGFLCLLTIANTGLSTQSLNTLFTDSYLRYVIRITLQQAFLSLMAASLIGICGAIAFHRRPHLFGRHWLLMGCFSAMIMPTTVASVALLKLWGQSGLIAGTPLAILLPDRLGLWSVILAHSFFNAPLIMRVCLSALDAIPQAQRRQAALLDLSSFDYFRYCDWPAIKAVLPSIMGLVFLLCFTSFALVLMLGGGPAVTTLEVSIYTALRFDFDLPKAALLSVIQLTICLAILAAFRPSGNHSTALSQLSQRPIIRSDSHRLSTIIADSAIITVIIILNIVPLLLLLGQSDILSGLSLLTKPRLYNALFHSTSLAIGASVLALAMSFLLSFFAHEMIMRKRRLLYQMLYQLVEITHSLFLIIPALVLGTALFLLLRPYGDVTAHGFWLLLLGNSLLALPFCYRIIAPALLLHLRATDHLCALLQISMTYRIFFIILPSLRREIGFALGLSAALSFGDLGIIALFGSQDFETLPYMLFQFLNRYGASEADFLALLLLLSSIGLYWLFTKLISYWGARLAR